MDAVTFFYTEGVGDLASNCIDLALIYKCSPYVFLDRPEAEVMQLYTLTCERLSQQSEE